MKKRIPKVTLILAALALAMVSLIVIESLTLPVFGQRIVCGTRSCICHCYSKKNCYCTVIPSTSCHCWCDDDLVGDKCKV